MEKFFPSLTAALNLMAAACYLYKADYPRMAYWLFAAGLTLTITWWMK